MEVYGRILDMAEFIEENLKNDLNQEALSKKAAFSKYHLHRLFKSLTNRNLMEYVRSRKLARSLSDLLNSNLRVDDIAVEYGFSSYSAYSRAFKKEFGISPNLYRKKPYTLPVTEKISRYQLFGAGASIVTRPLIVSRPAFTVAGIRRKVYPEENYTQNAANQAGVDFFYRRRGQIQNPVNEHVYIGLTLLPEEGREYTYYQPSIEISENSWIPSDMEVHIIPAQTYAVFTYVGLHPPEEISFKTLGPLWQYVFCEWMPMAGISGKMRMSFEEIDIRQCSEDYCEARLYYPINQL